MAVTREGIRIGIKSGVAHCATRSIGCVMPWVPQFDTSAHQLFKDPWAARDDYISVVLDRSPDNINKFFRQHASHDLSHEEVVTALKLLELQRNAMLMYTSCGWFFDELSGIETVQIIQYAGRVVQLAEELFDQSMEEAFTQRLGAPSATFRNTWTDKPST